MNLSRRESIYYTILKWEYLSQLSHLMLKNYSNVVVAKYPIFENFPSYCALCKKYDREIWEPGITTNRCHKCPLFIKWGYNCYDDTSPIKEWNRNKTKYNAQIIVNELKSVRNPIKFFWKYTIMRLLKKIKPNG